MIEKRNPKISPGVAYLPKESGDFNFPAELYYNSIWLYSLAQKMNKSKDDFLSSCYRRCAVQCAFSFFEAQLNQICLAHAKTHPDKIGEIELDILEEKNTTINDKGKIIRKTRYYDTEARVSFLCLFLTGKEFDRNKKFWQEFKKAKELRDKITHPKPPYESSIISLSEVKHAIEFLRKIFVELSKIMAINSPLWLKPVTRILAEIEKED
ncbi:MAG: hypothetical protein KJ957_06430 [Candidatus Omnitrophica bacterium]|nr:hypothetical protein [Candidatus Omnitrophota bacterium]